MRDLFMTGRGGPSTSSRGSSPNGWSDSAMLFNSVEYLAFFLIVGSIYFLLPFRLRWPLLLAASYYFYMSWKPAYIVLILISTCVDYSVGRALGNTGAPRARRRLLLVSLCTNLGILFAFKYFNFINRSLHGLFGFVGLPYAIPDLDVTLPVGLSFYTFQAMSHTIDVYRGNRQPERHLGRFALFVAFFPQLVAGPIERASHLVPQFLKDHHFDWERTSRGLQQILWGLFKKVVIADRAAMYVDAVYNNVDQHGGLSFMLATYLFAVQIYCDFSGYSDMAVGSARILGFDLMENFNLPYFSRSITEFWRRWHISLSTWLRDYLYISLGGNRISPKRTSFNLQATMLLGGLWHGANWTFVVWGGLQGLFLSLEKRLSGAGDRFLGRLGVPVAGRNAIWWLWTFHLVCLSWVFFRANHIGDAFRILGSILGNPGSLFIEPLVLTHCAVSVVVLIMVDLLQSRRNLYDWFGRRSLVTRWACYYALIFSVALLGVDGGVQFIYFQF